MAFPNRLLSPSTWRHVGLGLTTTVFALGGLAILAPPVAAESLGVTPTTPEGRTITEKAMVFLGIRDLAAAVALFWFYHDGKTQEMGVLTTAWTLVCVTDTWVATQGPRGWDKGIWTLCGGAVVVAFVGLGLLQS
ncbi:af2f68d8-a8b9-4184-a20b-578be24afbb9-CDS [Sclerotinia trifoliorum]|uniref:Af2f68d8-a8b9-4184-a20b-578be24afbb9-CDS n=1 Tax=Sclerotinia trifoliorum TaxID=28548 RepID=A0A8H2VX06_9HELO|nr:af2f68d8-a8b9-4184-a20b-578be24afbb9-CDS [Sclerotinia trifoliorum]